MSGDLIPISQRDHWRELAATQPGTLLFETTGTGIIGTSHLFQHPRTVFQAACEADLPQLLADLETALGQGHSIAGLLHYEAGHAFERVRGPHRVTGDLAWFGIFDAPEIATWQVEASQDQVLDAPLCLEIETARADYLRSVVEAQKFIAAGDTYQLNLTTALATQTAVSPLHLYRALAAQQPAPYSALLHPMPGRHVLSFSPELFFRIEPTPAQSSRSTDGNAPEPAARTITVRPMKGTAPATGSETEIARQHSWLATDEKNRAEHVMIVDLLRNDLGRICRTGTVHADRLFEIERYRTVLQMTSTLSGQLAPETRLGSILRALFPCGSVTGAPKPRSMELLSALEPRPRGLYTGTLGFASPDGTASFSVAIRTLTLDRGRLRLGIGSGVVADSVPEHELRECWLKAEFLLRASPPFSIVEGLLWERGGFKYLDDHLERMRISADQLGFPFDLERILATLSAFTTGSRHRRVRIRALLHRDGSLTCREVPYVAWQKALKVAVSPTKTHKSDPFLQHKTTHRPVYDEEARLAVQSGFDEAIFLNHHEELTEGAISSLLLHLDGAWLTPHTACGVLPGVARSRLLRAGVIREAVLNLIDLRHARAICLCNGVRGIGRVGSVTLPTLKTLHFRPASGSDPLFQAG